MELATLLQQNRKAILGKWFDLIIETYPRDASNFLAKQKDRFRNPVGHAIAQDIGPIFDEITTTMDTERLRTALDGIVRIRTVQDFAPSEAVAFVFQLKGLIREELAARNGRLEEPDELAALEERIDRVALLAFDKYTECREKLHDIRIREIKSQSTRLMQRVNAVPGAPCDGQSCVDTTSDANNTNGGGGI
jgi:hypothetical protein